MRQSTLTCFICFCFSNFLFFHSCRSKADCKRIFENKVEYCLTSQYSGSVENRPFSSSAKYYRIISKSGLEEIEVEWHPKSVDTEKNSWHEHVQDLMKVSEEVEVLRIDTFNDHSLIELVFADKDIFFIEKTSSDEDGNLLIRYRCKNRLTCLNQKARLFTILDKIKKV